MKQTCIIRFRDPYIIIMTPGTDDFEYQIGDMNALYSEEKVKNLIQETLKKGQSSVQIGPTNLDLSKFNLNSLHNIHNLLFNNSQKSTLNGLIIKLVRYDFGLIRYVVTNMILIYISLLIYRKRKK